MIGKSGRFIEFSVSGQLSLMVKHRISGERICHSIAETAIGLFEPGLVN